jgi:hypothetical protein
VTLDEFLLRDLLDDYDITNDVRTGLAARGISFDSMSWRETEEIVEKAIKPLRDEIARLRTRDSRRG